MKKSIWIVGGVLVLVGAGLFISRERAQEAESVDLTVSQASRLPGADEGRLDGGDTGRSDREFGNLTVMNRKFLISRTFSFSV